MLQPVRWVLSVNQLQNTSCNTSSASSDFFILAMVSQQLHLDLLHRIYRRRSKVGYFNKWKIPKGKEKPQGEGFMNSKFKVQSSAFKS
jgi:hypothetical protein